jgi:hypothetical protein
MENNKIPDYLLDILKEMLNKVNGNVEDIETFIKQPNWFYTYEWNKEQEQEFVYWLAEYFKENKKVFQILTKGLTNNKKNRLKASNEFTWNYGWKTKE